VAAGDKPLQKAPLGLLGLLDLKTLGRNPDGFNNTVVATIEASDMYGAPNAQILTASGNLQNVGDTLSLTVPSSTAYRVRSFAGAVTTIATENAGLALGFQTSANSNFAPWYSQNSTQAAAAQNFRAARYFERPPIIGPGSILLVYNLIAFGAARAASLVAVVEPIPA
jgi:hypothetical protein